MILPRLHQFLGIAGQKSCYRCSLCVLQAMNPIPLMFMEYSLLEMIWNSCGILFLIVPEMLLSPLSRLFTYALAPFGVGRHFIVRITASFSRRCVRGWRTRRGICSTDLAGNIICGLTYLQLLRRFTIIMICNSSMFFIFLCLDCWILAAVCILVMQRPGVILKTL